MELSFQSATLQDVDLIFQLNKELIDRYEKVKDISYDDVLAWVRRKIEQNIDSYTRICADGVHAGFYRFVPNEEKIPPIHARAILTVSLGIRDFDAKNKTTIADIYENSEKI